MNPADQQTLAQLYPALRTALAPLDAQALPVMEVPAGTTLFHENSPCAGFPLLLSGEVRVSRSARSGREPDTHRVAPAGGGVVRAAFRPS